MREEIIELGKMGPLPPSDLAVRDNSQELIDKYEKLIMSVTKPVTDEEARVLTRVFGSDDAFGLVWPLVDLIESAPNWPLADCLRDTNNEWIQLLKLRLKNAEQP